MERIVLLCLFILSGCATGGFRSNSSLDIYKSLTLPESLYKLSLYSNDKVQENPSSARQCMEQGRGKEYERLQAEFEKNNRDVTINKQLGDCEGINGDFGKAFFYYDRVLALTKQKKIQASVFNNLGLVFIKKGLFSYGQYFLELAEKSDRKNGLIVYNQMIIKMRAGKFLEAAEMVRKRIWKLADKSYWSKMVALNYFLQGGLDQEIIKTIKGIDDKSSEMGLLQLASSYSSWINNPELKETNLATLEQLQFKDPLWKDAKSLLESRISQIEAAYEKD